MTLVDLMPKDFNFFRRRIEALVEAHGTRRIVAIAHEDCAWYRTRAIGPVVADLLGAHIPLGIIDIPSAEAALASGKVRALAISSAQRFEGLPDLPTFQEAGLKDFESIGFLGILAPAGVPPDALATIHRAFVTVLRDPEVLARFKSFGSRPMTTDPKEFGDFIASEIKKWTTVVDAAHLRQK
jgi:tripartite-type tricarboxylate transporter receptor subunit TctC